MNNARLIEHGAAQDTGAIARGAPTAQPPGGGRGVTTASSTRTSWTVAIPRAPPSTIQLAAVAAERVPIDKRDCLGRVQLLTT